MIWDPYYQGILLFSGVYFRAPYFRKPSFGASRCSGLFGFGGFVSGKEKCFEVFGLSS